MWKYLVAASLAALPVAAAAQTADYAKFVKEFDIKGE